MNIIERQTIMCKQNIEMSNGQCI